VVGQLAHGRQPESLPVPEDQAGPPHHQHHPGPGQAGPGPPAVGIPRVGGQGGPLGPADQAALAREVALARRIPGVVRASEVALSPDGRAAEIAVSARIAEASPSAGRGLVDALEGTFGKVRAPSGLRSERKRTTCLTASHPQP